jgi:hypothetical protein
MCATVAHELADERPTPEADEAGIFTVKVTVVVNLGATA